MAEYVFYQKGRDIVAVRRDDTADADMMEQCGYVRQEEEVRAAGENEALRRLQLMRKEGRDSLKNFTKVTLFGSLISIIIDLFSFSKGE